MDPVFSTASNPVACFSGNNPLWGR